jgi:hypothetical protein
VWTSGFDEMTQCDEEQSQIDENNVVLTTWEM